ncbi:SelT/SelW/SelH family protein [Arachidicoccus soli]|uniref:SelT/SelW/SelH family protein n=1 Tax=Arachidicoccus soli TaxID=2341117 RepID=A0A386HPR1_9BACT|nr:SelT/SelW/SelH family protein [Arachidicoccus soli]AYD47682.1 SelT/SelW/SelH family protein [Arachidicoccus soli]
MKPIITIEYCPKCGWLLRSAYIAQELLTTFVNDLEGILLKPSEEGGHFSIQINEVVVFDRKEQAGFPEIKTLKQIIRDIINPEKDLGHSDKKKEN